MNSSMHLAKSLKIKIFSGMAGIMVLYLAGLLAYFQLSALPSIFWDVDSRREEYGQALHQLAISISPLVDSQADLESRLEQEAVDQQMQLKLSGRDGHVLFSADYLPPGSFSFRARDVVYTADNVYVLDARYPFDWWQFRQLPSVGVVRGVVIASLLLACLLMIVFLHKMLVAPLAAMADSARQVDYNNLSQFNLAYHKDDELGQLSQAFEKLTHELAWSQEQQRELIAAVSHDLKGPLTSIIGYSERLASGKVREPEKYAQYLEIIAAKARALEDLADEFAEIQNLESAEFILNLVTVNVLEFFTEVINQVQKDADVHGFDFVASIQGIDDSLMIALDPPRIMRVVDNLVGNARKYAEKPLQIELELASDQSSLSCMIADNGPGVPATEMEHIFQRSYRVEKSRSREKGGSGLGLYICRQIIQAHGGAISAFQAASGGLGINFTLPLGKS